MAIIRWNPWSLDRLLEEDWDLPTVPFLSRAIGQGLNLYETENEVVAEAAVPGVSEDRIDVTVDNGVARVSASAQEKKEDTDKRRYFMSQMSRSYNYAFRLPESVAADKEPICEINDGVLTMRFPKTKKQAPRKLKVTRRAKEAKGK